MNRRDFMKAALRSSAALVLTAELDKLLQPALLNAAGTPVRWTFLVNTHTCIGCGFCVKACKLENEIPFEANVSRTWVERYLVTVDRKVFADSPREGRNGYASPQIAWGRDQITVVPPAKIAKAFFVPKLCNQCDKPPCVQVCPVGATYQAADGIVLVDRTWCIGCGYCIMACPYGMRFFHPLHRIADKCNFCYHRISKGMAPACVLACPVGARKIGDLENPRDPVANYIKRERVAVHKPEYGTNPRVYFIGLDEDVR
jgi:tetrathionate reductase subunit B